MTKEESLKLFRYFQQEFSKINKKLENTATKKDLDKVLVILDGMKGEIEATHLELAALTSQTSTQEDWIHKAASKMGIQYRNYT